MPDKIWVLNFDDFVHKEVATDSLRNYSLKYIQILKDNDICIVSPITKRDDAFVDYMARIKKLKRKDWMIVPKPYDEQKSFVQALTEDKEMIKKIKSLCAQGMVMIPLIYTKEFSKLSKMCDNKLLNNSIAVQDANNKLVFKKLCKEFGIKTIQPVYERGSNRKSRVLSFINFDEKYMLRRPVSAGGCGNTTGKLIDLLKLMKNYYKDGHFYIEKFRDIYRSLGSLCVLKDDGAHYIGIDCQLIHKEAWEGCEYPFTKIDKEILKKIETNTLKLAEYYYNKGVRGQINFDWAVIIKDGGLRLRALECNSRYNGFGLCLRLASTVFGISKEELHFYLDTSISFSKKLTTEKIIDIIEAINRKLPFRGGIVLTCDVREGRAGFCFIATSNKNVAELRKYFRKYILEGN